MNFFSKKPKVIYELSDKLRRRHIFAFMTIKTREEIMSSINSTSSMASELLLNKIMNGQIQTDSGKTITAGTRAASSALSRSALTPALDSATVAQGVAYANDYQSRLTEAIDYLTNLDKTLAGATDAEATALQANAVTFLGTIQASKINGVTAFAATPTALNAQLGDGATMAIGGKAGALINTYAGLTGTASELRTGITTALTGLNSELSSVSLQIQTLQGRSDLLDDVAATYSDAAANQYIVDTDSTQSLLENVLS